MGLFTKRRKAPAGGWKPCYAKVAACDGSQMEDDGCAGESAYGAQFTLATAPAASVTVWMYATFAAPDAPGDFQVGWRCEYEIDEGDPCTLCAGSGASPHGTPVCPYCGGTGRIILDADGLPAPTAPWRYAFHGLSDPRFYDDLGDADNAAFDAAEALLPGPQPGDGEWFDWDGVPW